MKIHFNQPKYVIPLILFPFALLFFFIYDSWAGPSNAKESVALTDSLKNLKTDQINPEMPGVSSEVSNEGIKDKFQALQEAYKYQKDYSALMSLGEKEAGQTDFASAYNSQELDSLSRVLQQSKTSMTNNMNALMSKRGRSAAPYSTGSSIEDLYQELNNRHYSAAQGGSDRPVAPTDEMSLFREKMRIVDSIEKAYMASSAGEGESGQNRGKSIEKKKSIDPSKDSTFQPLPVSAIEKTAKGFNTVRSFSPSDAIRAVIDQDEKVHVGSRIRIKLLQDIVVGENVIAKGSYIYGVITGFQTQRVNISISQIMFGGEPLPVRLDVFDSDGYLGLYVPESSFREFSKEIGTQGTSGLSSVTTSENSNAATTLVSRLFSTTTGSVSRMIQKEKAFLKDNYIIYLKEKR